MAKYLNTKMEKFIDSWMGESAAQRGGQDVNADKQSHGASPGALFSTFVFLLFQCFSFLKVTEDPAV
jgi:hypothetical protein